MASKSVLVGDRRGGRRDGQQGDGQASGGRGDPGQAMQPDDDDALTQLDNELSKLRREIDCVDENLHRYPRVSPEERTDRGRRLYMGPSPNERYMGPSPSERYMGPSPSERPSFGTPRPRPGEFDRRIHGFGGEAASFRRINRQRAIDMDYKDPDLTPAEKPVIQSSVTPTPSKSRKEVLETAAKDKKTMARNRRMFGTLVGTLHKFRSESDASKEREKKKLEVEMKLEQAEQHKREQEVNEKQQLLKAKRTKQAALRKIEYKKNLVTWLKDWEINYELQKNFIRTEAKPTIYWLPKIESDKSKELLNKSQQHITGAIHRARDHVKKDIKNIDEQIEDLSARGADDFEKANGDDADITNKEPQKEKDKENLDKNNQENEEDMQVDRGDDAGDRNSSTEEGEVYDTESSPQKSSQSTWGYGEQELDFEEDDEAAKSDGDMAVSEQEVSTTMPNLGVPITHAYEAMDDEMLSAREIPMPKSPCQDKNQGAPVEVGEPIKTDETVEVDSTMRDSQEIAGPSGNAEGKVENQSTPSSNLAEKTDADSKTGKPSDAKEGKAGKKKRLYSGQRKVPGKKRVAGSGWKRPRMVNVSSSSSSSGDSSGSSGSSSSSGSDSSSGGESDSSSSSGSVAKKKLSKKPYRKARK